MKVILIGRDPDKCDIYREVKDDSFVSRQHAQMMQDDDGRVYLLDLESKTGTFVNGNEVFGQTELKQGDFVKIGNTLLQWQSFFKQKASEIISEEPTIPEHQEVSRPQNEEPSVSEQKSSSYVRYASFGQRV
ncbi:MAG: FHA domain-containing protein, partial [Bacteroidota bacterium]|nr:FHA domain-containing protein [Bacteroidota bacterium]